MLPEEPTQDLRSDAPTAAGDSSQAGIPSPAIAMQPSQRLGDIELVRELGRGGMGVVWLGRDTLLGRDVAVKFITDTRLSRDDPGFRMFIDGARLAAQVQSPHLTQIYSAMVHDGIPCLVMEYCSGVSLHQLLAARGRFSLPAVLAIMGGVCQAAAELHEHGIVHGDIKPSNVLIEADGRIVLTDFGLTVSRPREQFHEAAHASGGTLKYMSPELFEGKASYQSDVYALGVMMFELLTGRAPFQGSPADLIAQHQGDALPWEVVGVDVQPALREVIDRAVHKSTRLRSKSARHLLDALRRAQPDVDVWASGHRQVIDAVHRGGTSDGHRPPASSRYGSSYYEAIEGLARQRGAMAGAPPLVPDGEAVAPLRPLPELAGDDVLDVSLPCVACDYDLRGLPVGASCPECTTPIPVSVDLSRLCLADPAWMKRLRSGMIEIVTLPVVFPLIAGLASFVPVLMEPARKQALIVPIALGTTGLLSFIAMFRATARDPATRRAPSAAGKDPAVRWLARLGVVMATLLVVLGNMIPASRLAGTVLLNLGIATAAFSAVCWLLWTQDLRRRGWSASDGDAIATAEPRRRRIMRNRLWRPPIFTLVLFVVPVALVMILTTTGKRSIYSWDFVLGMLLAMLAAAGLSLLVAGYLQALILSRILKREKRLDAAEAAAQITRALAASASLPTPPDTSSPSPPAPPGSPAPGPPPS